MKNLQVAYLLDFYGRLLPDKQREILEMYYEEDMSLAEIAESMGITRQGVHDSIRRGEKEIVSMEEKLCLMDRFLQISESLDTIESLIAPGGADDGVYDRITAELGKIRSKI